MAITIEQQPSGTLTAYNPIDYVLSSNNSGNTSFKYLAQLYINGVLQHTYALPPEPNTGSEYGELDISKVCESFVSFDFNSELDDIGIVTNDNSISEVQVVFGEQYDVSGVVTDFTGLASGTTIRVINGSLNFLEYIGFDYTSYLMDNNTGDKKFLTNSPVSRSVYTQQNDWLYFHVDKDDASFADAVRIETFDSLGATNGIFEIQNTFIAGGNVEDGHLRIPSGINLNAVPSGSVNVSFGALPILDADVYSYQMKVVDIANANTSETREFIRSLTCSKYDVFTIHFLNELGGFDSFPFELVKVKSWNKENASYKTEAKELSNAGALTRSFSNHQIRNYYTKTRQMYVLNSDWITEAESIWLREMFDSPIAYLYDGSNMIACNIDTGSYTERTRVNDRLFNIQIEVSFGFDNYRQRW